MHIDPAQSFPGPVPPRGKLLVTFIVTYSGVYRDLLSKQLPAPIFWLPGKVERRSTSPRVFLPLWKLLSARHVLLGLETSRGIAEGLGGGSSYP